MQIVLVFGFRNYQRLQVEDLSVPKLRRRPQRCVPAPAGPTLKFGRNMLEVSEVPIGCNCVT